MNIVFLLDVIVLFPLMWSFYLLWRERKNFQSLRPIIIGVVFLFVARISEVLIEHPTFHISNYLNVERPSFDIIMSIAGNFADVFAVLFLIIGFIQTIRSHRVQDETIHNLESLLPVCSTCKQYRTEDGTWHPIEQYIMERGGPDITHSLCPACTSQMREVIKKLKRGREQNITPGVE
jgi:type IV secretory pathway VirB2 component (pilin)